MLYKKIFMSLSGKEDESKAIQECMRIVSALKADLTVIHVNDPAAGYAHMMMDTLPKTTIDEMKEMFAKAGFGNQVNEIGFRLIRDESYAKAIAAATREADLLIMGHHSKNLLMAHLKDGIDERVADLIHCPVLLVPLN
ncbi:MAG: universal stress protein [Desulfobacteraceae bacterium]|jgi:nucleotide-binding universal stress UspA family protein